MTAEQLQRYRRETRARARHRARYWNRHDHAAYRCPDCGRGAAHPDVDWLEVHHRDGDPLNGAPDNLIGLCRRCHYVRHDRTPPRSLDDWKAGFLSLGDPVDEPLSGLQTVATDGGEDA